MPRDPEQGTLARNILIHKLKTFSYLQIILIHKLKTVPYSQIIRITIRKKQTNHLNLQTQDILLFTNNLNPQTEDILLIQKSFLPTNHSLVIAPMIIFSYIFFYPGCMKKRRNKSTCFCPRNIESFEQYHEWWGRVCALILALL